jgi:hypothetical protein
MAPGVCVCGRTERPARCHIPGHHTGAWLVTRPDAGPVFEETHHMSKIFIRNSDTYIVHAKIKGHSCGVSS